MILYMLKFVLCSGIMLGIYHLLLSREAMFRFNRFYLLLSLAFSALVPLISVNVPYQLPLAVSSIAESKTETAPLRVPPDEALSFPTSTLQTIDYKAEPTFTFDYQTYLPLILYGLVTVCLLVRFMLVFAKMRLLINNGKKIKYGNTQLVLLNDDIPPHSFFTNIYISKADFENGIDTEIIYHERAHIDQLHSVDIIIIELLQIVCWFNPFIVLYKRAIKLNHEFLADEAVLTRFNDTPQYQMLLLTKATQQPAQHLASQFNYLTIKKRLIMMTKTTSHKKAVLKTMLIVPVVAMAVFLFSEKVFAKPQMANNTIAIKKPASDSLQKKFIDALKKRTLFFKLTSKHSTTDASAEVLEKYNAILERNGITLTGTKKVREIASTDTAQLRSLFEQMSQAQQKVQFVQFLGPARAMKQSNRKVTEQQLREWQGDAKKYGVWVDDKRIKNIDLGKYKPEDFDTYFFSKLYGNARKNDGFAFQADLSTNAYSKAMHSKRLKEIEESNKKPRMHQLQLIGDKLIGYGSF